MQLPQFRPILFVHAPNKWLPPQNYHLLAHQRGCRLILLCTIILLINGGCIRAHDRWLIISFSVGIMWNVTFIYLFAVKTISENRFGSFLHSFNPLLHIWPILKWLIQSVWTPSNYRVRVLYLVHDLILNVFWPLSVDLDCCPSLTHSFSILLYPSVFLIHFCSLWKYEEPVGLCYLINDGKRQSCHMSFMSWTFNFGILKMRMRRINWGWKNPFPLLIITPLILSHFSEKIHLKNYVTFLWNERMSKNAVPNTLPHPHRL